MSKRDEYYDGEEGDGAWVGVLVVAALVVLVVLCLSMMVAVGAG